MTKISVIIPLAPKEIAWQLMLTDLGILPKEVEIIFVTSDPILPFHKNILPNRIVKWAQCDAGRAGNMNQGAKVADGEYLWFLHDDSKFKHNTISALFTAIEKHPNSLLFFDLAFFGGISSLMSLNAWGTRFRSNILNIPFGDQGFCLKKEIFNNLGGFLENIEYGEDHMLIWKAKKNGVPVQSVGAKLLTSARKYRKYGWLRTTLLHQYLWLKQAIPELIRWKKK